jgi:hypothetical protein
MQNMQYKISFILIIGDNAHQISKSLFQYIYAFAYKSGH